MEKELTATYDGDSRYYYCFHIDRGQGVTGNIYVPKDEPVPRTLTIRLGELGPRPKQRSRVRSWG
jgi:hypothetical protein